MGTSLSVSGDMSGMTHCDGMDTTQPGLCHAHAHDQTNKQSLDKPDFPEVAPFAPAGLVLVATLVDSAAYPTTFSPVSQFLTRATAPPISIRNCCFRI